jgi:hypothetical protein
MKHEAWFRHTKPGKPGSYKERSDLFTWVALDYAGLGHCPVVSDYAGLAPG